MVNSIRIDRHVAHDLVDQLEIRVFAGRGGLNGAFEHIENDRHIAMIFTKLAQKLLCIGFHTGILPQGRASRYRDKPLSVARDSPRAPSV